MGAFWSLFLIYYDKFASKLFTVKFRMAVMTIQYYLNGFPRYRSMYIRSIRFACPHEELERYKLFSEHLQLPCLILPFISALIVAKRLFFTTQLTRLAPRQEPDDELIRKLFNEPHLRNIHRNYTHLIQFGDCLLTNCTFFTRNSYNILPLFSICNFGVSHYFLPTSGWSLFSIITDICFTWHVLLYGIIVSTYMYLYPCFDEFYMFVVSPISTHVVRLNRIKMHLRDFYDSFLNYYFAHAAKLLNMNQVKPQDKAEAIKFEAVSWHVRLNQTEELLSTDRENLRLEVQKVHELSRELYELNPKAMSFISDCSTLFRSSWWQLKARKQTTSLALLTLILLTLLCMVLEYLLYLQYESNKIDIIQVNSLIYSTGCFFKINREFPISVQRFIDPVDFSFFITNWSWTAWLEIIIIVIPSVFALSNVYGTFCSVYNDTNCIINEQLDRILVVIELSENYRSFSSNSSVRFRALNLFNSKFDFKQLRPIHQRRVELESNIIYTLKSIAKFDFDSEKNWWDNHDDENNLKSLVRKFILRNKTLDIDTYCGLLAKIYVGNRCLFELAEHLSLAYSVVIPIFIIWTHGFIILVVSFNKSLNQVNSLPFLFAMFGILANTVLISFPSNVQVESRKLIKLMLSLLACTAHFEDIRIKHARELYIRQVELLCWNNGITVKVLGIAITYKSVIRLAVVSSSLVALWLS